MTSKPSALSWFLLFLLIVLALVAIIQLLATMRETVVELEYPPSGDFIEVDGTKIHVKISGQGPDIVLIHGASGSLRDFTFDLVALLEDRYRVIAVDRPGLGWSERPQGYGGAFNVAAEPPELQARLLQGAMDALDVDNPIVLGHSYGGAIALAWALERPDHTAGLVLVSAASNPWQGELGWLYRVNASLPGSAVAVPFLSAFTPHRVLEGKLGEIFAPQAPPEGYMKHFGVDMTLRRKALRANAQQVNSLKPHLQRMATRYNTLNLPVESVHGTADTSVPIETHAEPLLRQIPGANLDRLEDVGHMPHHTHIDAVLAAVERVAQRAGLR